MLETEFAKQFLAMRGYSIFSNGKQILSLPDEDYLDFAPLRTSHIKGTDFVKAEKVEFEEIEYAELRDLGFCITENKDGYFIIVKPQKNTIPKKRCPADVIIQKNSFEKCVRILGWNCVTYWKTYSNQTEKPRMKYDVINKEYVIEPFNIPELPVMFGVENSLVCLPFNPDIVPKILEAGKTGQGKSLLLNSIVGRIWYKWNDKMGMLNDSLNGFVNLMLPNPDFQLDKLELIGEEPKRLPTINLYPSTKNLKMENEEISFKLVLDWMEFLNKYGFYTYGIEDLKLGAPQKYISSLAHAIRNAQTIEQVKTMMKDELTKETKKDKDYNTMIMKWASAFKKIFDSNITSNVVPDGHHHWELHRNGERIFSHHPFIVAAMAGIFPIMNTYQTDPKTNKIFRNQIADLLHKILKFQKDMGKNRKRFWAIIDEMNDLYEKGRGLKDNCAMALEEVFRQGRISKIGFIGNTQSYDKLDNVIRDNCSHLFVFNLQGKGERKAVKDDYELDTNQMRDIGNLKKFECMLLTKDDVVIYDKWGRKSVVQKKLIKGTIIPPISLHYSPKDKNK